MLRNAPMTDDPPRHDTDGRRGDDGLLARPADGDVPGPAAEKGEATTDDSPGPTDATEKEEFKEGGYGW